MGGDENSFPDNAHYAGTWGNQNAFTSCGIDVSPETGRSQDPASNSRAAQSSRSNVGSK
jgi:hypothetical protein